MADTPAAIGIRLRFVNIWIFGTATGWPPCCCFLRLVGGRRQRLLRGLLFLPAISFFLLAYLRLIAEGTTLLSFISGRAFIARIVWFPTHPLRVPS